MDAEEYVIVRNIHGHIMYYSGIQTCCTPEWIDDPTSAPIFRSEEHATKCLLAVQAVDQTEFPITIRPIKFTSEDEEQEEI